MTDRRDFLLAAAAGTLTLKEQTVLGADDTTGFIDAHVHVWTPDTTRYPLASGFEKKSMLPASFTPEELLALCKPNGVSRVVLIQMSFYRFDNSYMLESIARYPGVFSGVAIVDETQSNLRETVKSLAAKGVRGFRLYTNKTNAESWSSSTAMKSFWSIATDEGLAMCLLSDPDALPAVIQMCQQYPQTKVVIDHFSRIGIDGMIRQSDLDNLCRLAEFQHTFVKTSAFYALGKKQSPYKDLGEMVRKLRDTFGAQRLMWATDCPYQVQAGHNYMDSVALIRDRLNFLTAADKTAILRTTAEKVFFG